MALRVLSRRRLVIAPYARRHHRLDKVELRWSLDQVVVYLLLLDARSG